MKILYITYTDLENVTSGSGLRPASMYRAFLERGYAVKLLSGNCGRGEGKKRKQAVGEIYRWLEENTPDFCYIESPTYPILFRCDYDLIHRLHREKIPMAYFYRDFYRKFPDLFPRRRGLKNTLKEWYLDLLQKKTDHLLRLADIVYFPGQRTFRYFSYDDMRTLPPAGERCIQPIHENHKTCIYVGGVSESYGISLLMQTFTLLNQGGNRYPLILVCREAEYLREKEKIGNPDWLEIHHASGKELDPLYARADLGLLALQPNAYNQMAIGTKLFQYLKYGLPVISTDVESMKKLIDENYFGLTAPYDPAAYATAIRSLLDDDEKLVACRQEAVARLEQKHLWVHRVDQIARDLLGTKADF